MAGKKQDDLSWLDEYQPGYVAPSKVEAKQAAKPAAKEEDLSWLDEYQPKPREFAGLPGGGQGPPVADEIPLPPGVPVARLSGYDAKTGTWSVAPEKPMQTEFTDVPGKKLTAKEVGNIKTIDPGKPLRAAAAGALDAATLGFGDEIQAGISSIGEPAGTYEKQRDLNRRLIKESQAEDPKMAIAGGLVGGMSLAPLSMGASPARMLAEGTAIGAAAGLGSSEAELAGKNKDWGQAAIDVAKGGGIGLVGTGSVLGAQKVANVIRTAPERIVAKDDQKRLDALLHRFPKAQRDEMIGKLGEDAPYLLKVIKEDPALDAALMSGQKVEAGQILAAKAEAEKRALESTIGSISAERGPLAANRVVGAMEDEAGKLSRSVIPSSAKTAKELASTAAKIREEIMPVEGMGLVEKVAGKAGADAKRKIAASPSAYRQDLQELGVSGSIDDPIAVYEKIQAGRVAAESHLADKTREVAAKLGQIDAAEVADEFARSKVSSLAKRAEQIREEALPLNARQARAKVLSRAGAEEQKRIVSRLDDYQGEMDALGLQKVADDPVATYDTIVAGRKAVGESVGQFKDQIAPVPLGEFAGAYRKAAQELDRTATAASGLRHGDEAETYVLDLWKRYSPENVTADGKIVPIKGRKDISIPFEVARKELTDMQEIAFAGRFADPKPADKARRAIAGETLAYLEEQAAKSLSPDDAQKYIGLNKRYSRLITLEDAAEPARRAALLAPNPPTVFPRTGQIDAGELLAMRATASPEEKAAIDRVLSPRLSAVENAGEPAAGAYLSAREKVDRLTTLQEAIDPSYVSARTSANPPKVKPRTGEISIADAVAARNEITDEGAKGVLSGIIDSHIGKDNVAKLAAQTKRARATEQMAKSLDYQARDTASMINPGLRGVANESVGTVSSNAANMGVAGAIASGNPALMAAAAALKLGVMGAPAKVADKLDRGVAAMVSAARKGADNRALQKLGKLAGFSADLAEDVALTISQRIVPLKTGKVEE